MLRLKKGCAFPSGLKYVLMNTHTHIHLGEDVRKQSGHVRTRNKMLKDARQILHLFTSTVQGYNLKDSCPNLCYIVRCI